jgi:NAD(P)-dependent dehydrogenase (short-subunit alcohol dehydrogenase family)
MTQSVGRLMRAGGEGVIVNLITAAQTSARQKARVGAAFAATMSGLEGFTHLAAAELAPYGIHVHAVENGDEIVSKVMALLVSERDKS